LFYDVDFPGNIRIGRSGGGGVVVGVKRHVDF